MTSFIPLRQPVHQSQEIGFNGRKPAVERLDHFFDLAFAFVGRTVGCSQHDRSGEVRQAPGAVQIRSAFETGQFLVCNTEIDDAVLELMQLTAAFPGFDAPNGADSRLELASIKGDYTVRS